MNQKGLTLVEVLISTVIVILVGSLLLAIIVNSTGLFYQESAKVNMGLSTNDALISIRKSLKESSGVAASYSNDSVTYTSKADQIVLKVPSLDSSGDNILNTYDYVIFSLDQGKLTLKTFPSAQSTRAAANQVFSNSVDSLVFGYFNLANPPVEVAPQSAGKVRVSLVLKQRSGSTEETNIATTEANLRND